MNYLQANLCLLCVTFCWSTEVIIFSCIPDAVSPFAVTSIIYSLEIVFSVFLGAVLPASLIDPVHLTPWLATGVACVVAGNLIEILDPEKIRNKGKEAVT